jgi:hypothetical protein
MQYEDIPSVLGPLVEVPLYSVKSQVLVRNYAFNFKDQGYNNVPCG